MLDADEDLLLLPQEGLLPQTMDDDELNLDDPNNDPNNVLAQLDAYEESGPLGLFKFFR
jgi:hypothetical protein